MLILIEGIDGAGKTSIVNSLTQMLRLEGYNVHATREPWHHELREACKANTYNLGLRALDALFMADHLAHMEAMDEVMGNCDAIVLSDRGIWSAMAYSAYRHHGNPPYDLLSVYKQLGSAIPAHVIYLDVNVSEALTRLEMRGDQDPYANREALLALKAEYAAIRGRWPLRQYTTVVADHRHSVVLLACYAATKRAYLRRGQ